MRAVRRSSVSGLAKALMKRTIVPESWVGDCKDVNVSAGKPSCVARVELMRATISWQCFRYDVIIGT